MTAQKSTIGFNILESWWVALAFIPIIGWVGFLYAGFASRNKRLIYSAFIYIIPMVLLIIQQDQFLGPFFFIFYIAGFVHALIEQRGFLERRWNIRVASVTESYSQPISPKRKGKLKTLSIDFGTEINDKNSDSEISKTIDINKADENQLASLPFMTLVLAKKAIEQRETNGSFESLEDFGLSIGLKPHMIEKIRPHIKVAKIKSEHQNVNKGRVLDI